MRTLIIFAVGSIIVIALFVAKRLDARQRPDLGDTVGSEALTLSARLEQSATLYKTAALALPETHEPLKSTISGLADRCRDLAGREGFSRAARSTIIRLLLSLNDVIQRATSPKIVSVSSDAAAALAVRTTELVVQADET